MTTPLPTPNEGERPSQLELGRYAAGELDDAARAHVEARLDDEARAWLAAVEAAKAVTPPVDVAALRRRAAADAPRAANHNRWYGLALLAAAVLLAVFAVPRLQAPTGPDVRFRKGDALVVHRLVEGQLRRYEPGTAVGAGDVLGFKVVADGHHGVVVLSVDGHGQVEVFWPERGDEPEPLAGQGLVPLPGSLTLDDAPGPEVFVAVFDEDVARAKADVEHAWQSGGTIGVLDWAGAAGDVDAVEVTRR